MITIFSQPAESSQEPFSLAASALAHGALIGLAFFGLIHAPRIREAGLSERFSLRRLEMRMPGRQLQLTAGNAASDPRPQFLTDATSLWKKQADVKAVASLMALQSQPHQSVIQPDALHNLLYPKDVYLPGLLLWSTENSSALKIVPPPPQANASADVSPSLQLPNREVNLAELELTSSDFTSKAVQLVPGTTSPVTVSEPGLEKRVPETTSQLSGQATQSRIMSLSDHLATNGTTLVPRANDVLSPSSSGAFGRGRSNGPGQSGSESAASQSGAGQGSGAPRQYSTRHLTLPKDGKFSMVLVGNSVEEQYPETAGMWSGRLAYTVFLHLGTTRNWILQYSLPRSDQGAGIESTGHLEAPWPTDILVPDLPPGLDGSDTLVVHGFVNRDGRFETVATVFPPKFAQAKFMLDTLRKWIFRPALLDGQIATVEVLLIIPQ